MGKRRDSGSARDSEPCSEIIPKADAELGAGLEEGQEGVATVATEIAAGAARDFAPESESRKKTSMPPDPRSTTKDCRYCINCTSRRRPASPLPRHSTDRGWSGRADRAVRAGSPIRRDGALCSRGALGATASGIKVSSGGRELLVLDGAPNHRCRDLAILRSRANKKARAVTVTAPASAYAANETGAGPTAKPKPAPSKSSKALAQFKVACDHWLPLLNERDQDQASSMFEKLRNSRGSPGQAA